MRIKEGLANLNVTEYTFYNPKMKRLRDISIAFLKAAAPKDYTVLDATAATGVRGIRYLLEARAGRAVFLDINSKAYEAIVGNISLNGLDGKAIAINKSIQEFANTSKERFDAIDLDPFGTPAPYVFDLMKISKDGTLFMATATDTATLCGAEGKASLRIYGAKAINGYICHEASIRILLAYFAKMAAQFNYGIEPLLSLAELHYVRIFLKLNRGSEKAVKSVESIGFASLCRKCGSFYYSRYCPNQKCEFCGTETQAFGPLWLSSLHSKQVVEKMLDYAEDRQIKNTLEKIKEEADIPFFYNIDLITRYLGVGSVSRSKVIEALKSEGKSASITVLGKNGIKTNARMEEVAEAVKSAGQAHT